MSYASPYGVPGAIPVSPVMQAAQPVYPQFTPAQAQSIQPGSITYTTTTGADGHVTYHPFRAVAASYQTPQGVVSGIQWIPAEATSVLPAGATPAGSDFAASFARPGAGGDDRYSANRRSSYYDRDSDRDRDRDRDRDDREYRRREREREDRERERDRDDRDARRMRDRDPRERDRLRENRLSSAGYGSGGGYPSDYDKYGTSDLERRFGELEVDRRDERDREYERDRERERDRELRHRRSGVFSDRERDRSSTYTAAPGGAYPSTAPYNNTGSAYDAPRAGYTTAPGGNYPASAGYRAPSPRPGDIMPQRPVSPYRGPGAIPGGSPYQAPVQIAPRPVSPYHGGGTIPRAASPYGGGGAIPRAASPYGGPRSSSPLPGAYPRGHIMEGQQVRPISRAGSPSPYGAAPATIYATPGVAPGSIYASPGATAGGLYGAGAPTAAGPYGASGGYAGSGIGAHASPRMGAAPLAQPAPAPDAMLPAPEGFSRPPNRAQPYTQFETTKIQDMDDFLEVIPRMPLVLVPHDVYHEDWIRLMNDLAMAWAGTMPVPQYSPDGRPPKRSTLAADVVDLWNAQFLRPRGVELVLYKGRERRSGRLAGKVDVDLPGFDPRDVSSPSESESSGGADERERERYSVYGRQGERETAELREARRARRERRAERRKRKMDKKVRKRTKEMERTYALYLMCASPYEAQ